MPERPPIFSEEPKNEIEHITDAEQLAAQADKGLLNQIRKLINNMVAESKLPTQEGLGFESTMGIYGGKLAKDSDGKLVYDSRAVRHKIDIIGDRLVRAFDEHHMKQPGKVALRHPKLFVKSLPFLVDSKRYRGTPEQTMDNVRRLGLEQYYGPHPWGIEIIDPKLFSHSYGLQDIFRQDIINSEDLSRIDRFDALGKATNYLYQIHHPTKDTGSQVGLGEGNVYNFLFTERQGDVVSKPVPMVPTEIYNPEKKISFIEQRATELLDLFASVGFEEYRRSQDWNSVRTAFQTILEHYQQDPQTIHMVASYLKRGRLTLPHDTAGLETETSKGHKAIRPLFALHNTQRLSADPKISAQLRLEITNL